MTTRLLELADTVMHFLYEPALGGRKAGAVPDWAARIHLIPGSWLEKVCNAYDRRLTDA